jgi:hypothetical protein
MKKNHSLFCLTLLLGVYVSSCNNTPELVFNSTQDGISMKVWEVQRSPFESKSSSNGEKLITGNGDLEYLLKSIHNADDADLDITELSKKNKGYKVEVKSSNGKNIKEDINQTLISWLTDAGFQVFYGQKDHEIYSLTVEDEALLLENIYESIDGRTNYLKTTSKVILLEGSIKHLALTLEKQESSKPIVLSVSDHLKSKLFTMTLKRSDGIEGIIEQLSDQYGIRMQKETRRRKVLKVK